VEIDYRKIIFGMKYAISVSNDELICYIKEGKKYVT
jgi:hypothetical protein